MKLPGWQSLGGTSSRYINPQGEEVSRREYLNAQARSVGYKSYSQFQRQMLDPMYRGLIDRSPNPNEARKVDSALNSQWAKTILPKRYIEKQPKWKWDLVFDAAGVEQDTEFWENYKSLKGE